MRERGFWRQDFPVGTVWIFGLYLVLVAPVAKFARVWLER